MSGFFTDLVDRISLLWDMLINLIKSLLSAIGILSNGSVLVLDFALLMPVFVTTCITVVISISVIKFIIGR